MSGTSVELQTLKDAISEKVGKELISLIPKEQWDMLIEGQIKVFLQQMHPEANDENKVLSWPSFFRLVACLIVFNALFLGGAVVVKDALGLDSHLEHMHGHGHSHSHTNHQHTH